MAPVERSDPPIEPARFPVDARRAVRHGEGRQPGLEHRDVSREGASRGLQGRATHARKMTFHIAQAVAGYWWKLLQIWKRSTFQIA